MDKKTDFSSKQRVNLFLDPQVVKRAKGQALQSGVSLSRFIEKELTKVLPSTVKISGKI